MPGGSKELYAGYTNEIYLSVSWELPGGPVVKTQCFHHREHGFAPWLRNEDPACSAELPSIK